jgi:hypothetical protein
MKLNTSKKIILLCLGISSLIATNALADVSPSPSTQHLEFVREASWGGNVKPFLMAKGLDPRETCIKQFNLVQPPTTAVSVFKAFGLFNKPCASATDSDRVVLMAQFETDSNALGVVQQNGEVQAITVGAFLGCRPNDRDCQLTRLCTGEIRENCIVATKGNLLSEIRVITPDLTDPYTCSFCEFYACALPDRPVSGCYLYYHLRNQLISYQIAGFSNADQCKKAHAKDPWCANVATSLRSGQ